MGDRLTFQSSSVPVGCLLQQTSCAGSGFF